MVKIKKLSDMLGKRVYTDGGDSFGVIEEVNLVDNKIDGWKIAIYRDSSLGPALGSARGIIVPHHFVKAIGDVFLINKGIVPEPKEDEDINLDEQPLDV